jgi:hypothetical protein
MRPSALSEISPSRAFYRVGAACCVYYIAAQLIQEITFHIGLNDSAVGEAEILQRLTSLDHLRAVLLLLGFTFIPIITAFAGVSLRRYRIRPAASVLGLGFSFLFVASEMSVRSIDLFLVSQSWATEYQAATSEALKREIAARIQFWDDSVTAFYFALLGVHLLASVCFALATWDKRKWDRLAAAGFAASALETVGRLAEGYLGQAWLDGFNHATYFPVVLLSFGTLAVWLWKEAERSATEDIIGERGCAATTGVVERR